EFNPGLFRNDEPNRAEVLNVALRSLSSMIGKPERRNWKPQSPSADARLTGQSPVLSESRHTGRTALCPRMSLAPAAVPNPGSTFLLSFGGWDHYSLWLDMSTWLVDTLAESDLA